MAKRRLAAAALLAAGLGLTASFYAVALPARLSLGDGATVRWRDGSLAQAFLTVDDRWRLGADPARIDPAYLRALRLIEDERFDWHPGVDPLSILRALRSNLRSRSVVSGASTITMQLARLLEPKPRTLGSKVIEAWRALQLQARLGRERVLREYLRFLPFGGNLEGVEAASYAYFGHSAEHLSPAEIATLLAVPQRPGDRAPTPRNQERLRAARDQLLMRLHALDFMDDAALETALAANVPRHRQAVPQDLPHAARWLLAENPGSQHLQSTLDKPSQRIAQALLARGAAHRRDRGVHHGALVVIDRRDNSVAALVGGADFFAREDGAQLPSFDLPRSAASTLKPVITGLAMDRGLVSPAQRLEDLPTSIGGYRPENFDERFRGLVTLRDALQASLNVPFVNLLRQLRVDRFTDALRRAGLAHLHDSPDHYGLAAALGTIPVTPLELAGIYAGIAGDGRVNWPKRLMDDKPSASSPLMSAEAAWMVRDILKGRDRPDFPERSALYGLPSHVFWKTGTSLGYRDAWSIGGDERYVAVVWFGNHDRRPSRSLVGSSMAGPLLFELLDALGHGDRERRLDPAPTGLTQVEVCRFSGAPIGPACDESAWTQAPRRSVPTEPCPFHRRVHRKPGTMARFADGCAPPGSEPENALLLSSRLRQFLSEPLPAPVEVTTCDTGASNPLSWVAPAAQEVALIDGMPAEQQQLMLQVAAQEGVTVSWFVDGAFLGSRPAGEALWWTPTRGKHELLVMDAAGRKLRRPLVVH